MFKVRSLLVFVNHQYNLLMLTGVNYRYHGIKFIEVCAWGLI